MCSIDFDEVYDIWEQTWRTASAPHRCDSCHGRIGVGERYQRHFAGHYREGQGVRDSVCEKVCAPCADIIKDFMDEHGTCGNPSWMYDGLEECVDGLRYHPETARWQLALTQMEARAAAAKAVTNV
jgi:hypothetical protein